MIATLSGMVASPFAVSKLYTMLHEMGHGQVPRLKGKEEHQSLFIAAGLAIVMVPSLTYLLQSRL
ncbi:hypothetical protein [Paeniglutamicibacter cryotolerans]|uniref:Uncharacterized protein n=1 Tax=Paeniglutamicibacter cryotolerans TaxID=670079 RepID=A0A839QII6_9MICC|nr:hypothetical protein [Paeniglutamicibacter cryotolerans]MBB2995670.1 hypothetical protein [Paeniglutamicibacter cryotolerans]